MDGNAFNMGKVWNPLCCHGNETSKLVLWGTFSGILLQKIKHFWYILAEISYYEISYYFRLHLDRVKHNYLCFGFFSEPTNPSHLKQAGLSNFFFDGDANDPNVQAAIKTKYVSFMTTSNMVPPIFCPRFTAQCHEDYIEVYAGSSGTTKCNKA